MKRLFFLSIFCFFGVAGAALSEYWLIEQDFIKLGKRDLYEQQKKDFLSKKRDFLKSEKELVGVFGFEDLENPQYVFLNELKNLSSLELHEPLNQKEREESLLLQNSLHFQIFSLHKFLKPCSLKEELVFESSDQYFFYAIYDIVPGNQSIFESALAVSADKFAKDSFGWCVFKSLLAGDCPKYVICLSFPSKEKMKEWNMEKIVSDIKLRDIFRDKKTGWMKRSSF